MPIHWFSAQTPKQQKYQPVLLNKRWRWMHEPPLPVCSSAVELRQRLWEAITLQEVLLSEHTQSLRRSLLAQSWSRLFHLCAQSLSGSESPSRIIKRPVGPLDLTLTSDQDCDAFTLTEQQEILSKLCGISRIKPLKKKCEKNSVVFWCEWLCSFKSFEKNSPLN